MIAAVAEAPGSEAAILVGSGGGVEAVELDLIHGSFGPFGQSHIVMGDLLFLSNLIEIRARSG